MGLQIILSIFWPETSGSVPMGEHHGNNYAMRDSNIKRLFLAYPASLRVLQVICRILARCLLLYFSADKLNRHNEVVTEETSVT